MEKKRIGKLSNQERHTRTKLGAKSGPAKEGQQTPLEYLSEIGTEVPTVKGSTQGYALSQGVGFDRTKTMDEYV